MPTIQILNRSERTLARLRAKDLPEPAQRRAERRAAVLRIPLGK